MDACRLVPSRDGDGAENSNRKRGSKAGWRAYEASDNVRAIEALQAAATKGRSMAKCKLLLAKVI